MYTGPLAVAILAAGAVLGGLSGLPVTILLALAALLPSALFRPGLLVFVVVSAIYLPLLGTYGLWDPWETHYGEVAREILARDDWISLWWAQENWFWSKPILIFWSEALTMGALGVDYLPDADPAHPEWAVRLPIVIMALGAVMAVYTAVGRIFGRRAGVLSALVLASMPHFFFLAHQAITDIPFVANMTIAMSMLALALNEDPDREVTTYRWGKITLSGQHVLLGALILVSLPQILYLVSRNVTMVDPFLFAWHGDEFMYGSAGNLGVPGNAPVRDVRPFAKAFQPALQGLLWLVGLLALFAFVRNERRAQSLFMFAFYLFCGFAFMGKGIPGFALPGLVSLLFLVASKRWDLLFEGRLRIAAGALIITVVGLPWYVAMYVRHGPPFTDRLLIHDHINRLAAGVHGDEGSIEYFINQLGFATFPWVALVPAALLSWLWYQRARVDQPAFAQPSVGAARAAAVAAEAEPAEVTRPSGEPALLATDASPDAAVERHRRDTLTLIAIWFFAAFTLFSAMITKFHHYIFPAVPPAAILVGILVDRMFGRAVERGEPLAGEGPYRAAGADAEAPWFSWNAAVGTGLAAVAAVPLVLGVAGLYGDVRGVIPEDVSGVAAQDWVLHHGWSPALSGSCILIGLALLAGGAYFLWHRGMLGRIRDRGPSAGATLGATIAAGSVLGAFVGRDLSWETAARPQGYERLIHLFVYNYGRAWPEQFDYRPILTGFAVVAIVLLALAVARHIRPLASRSLVGVGLMFSAWALNVYMIDLSPHWSQRGLVKTYYEERTGPEEPLVAWQMNWKGENFYTGNRVSVFVDLDNKEVREWIQENKGRTAFFILEHTRLGSFRSLVRGREIREVTDKRDCNKFVLLEVAL
jgi:4-amino-4-deoxy-L-arabinose transferase-like glycosyltransferase